MGAYNIIDYLLSFSFYYITHLEEKLVHLQTVKITFD